MNRAEAKVAIRRLLAEGLSRLDVQLLMMVHVEELTFEEIADVLGDRREAAAVAQRHAMLLADLRGLLGTPSEPRPAEASAKEGAP